MSPPVCEAAPRPVEVPNSGPRVRTVLFIRCCRSFLLDQSLAMVRAMYPDAQHWCLSQKEYFREVEVIGITNHLEYRGKRIGILSGGIRLLRDIRRRRFDLIVIPYMGSTTYDYANVLRFAYLSRSRTYLLIPQLGNPTLLHRAELRDYMFLEGNSDFASLVGLDVPLTFLGLALAVFKTNWWPDRRPSRDGKKKVLHIINSLGCGGAQRQLAELVRLTPRDRYEPEVLVMCRFDGDFSKAELLSSGVTVTFLRSWPNMFSSFLEIYRRCRATRYDIVHTWLFMSNVIGAAAARLAGSSRIIASVRNMSLWKRTWYNLYWYRAADALAVRIADVTTVNAPSLVRDHAEWSFLPADEIAVVPNGIDAESFCGMPGGARERLRSELGLPENCLIVGSVGRLAPEKDHQTFLQMMKLLQRRIPGVYGIIVGGGEYAHRLAATVIDLELTGTVRLLGERSDARELLAGLDLFVLTSKIEGFPNVLLEAGLLQVPAIATDVGACRDVLGNTRDIFPPGDASGLADRAAFLLMHPDEAGKRAAATRSRILEYFTNERSASSWLTLYESRPVPRWPSVEAAAALEREHSA